MSKKKKLKQLQEETRIDELFQGLNENSPKRTKANTFQREIDHPKEILKQQEEEHPKEEAKEQVKKELERVRKETKKKRYKSNFLALFLLFITMVLETCYLGYNIIYMAEEKNQLFLIINSALLLIVTSSFGLGMFLKKDKGKRFVNVVTSLLFVILITFNILVATNIVKLPTKSVVLDFRNQKVIEAIKWANNHHINLTTKYEYSDEFETNTIMKQSVEPDTLTSKVDSMEIVVSDGPNYELEVEIPDMIGWNIDDVVEVIKKNKLNNVNIDYEFQEEIDRDEEYEQDKSGTMKRNDELNLKFSLGREEDLKPVPLEDLTGMEEFDATLWLKRNGIDYEITYEYSDSVEKGKVIKTDPKKGTVIDQKETTVKLTISKGKKIEAPDFTKMSLEEIEEWANENRIKINYSSEYSSDVKAGNVIRASVKKGDSVDEGDTIYIVTSKGALKMIDYNDDEVDKIRAFANEHDLGFVLNEEFSDTIEKGKIIRVDKKPGQSLNQSETITVVVSLGKKNTVPNFIGMTRKEAENACDENHLSCTFNYAYSTREKNTVINQNKTAGSEVTEGTNVVLTISNGERPTSSNPNPSDPSGGNDNNNNNNNNNGNNSNNPEPDPEPVCDRNKTVRVYINPTIGDASATARNLDSRIHWNIVYVSRADYPESASIGMVIASDVAKYDGKDLNMCDTYTIHIFNS